jgi:TatD DNase family protein
MIDTHAHLTDSRYQDVSALIDSAKNVGVNSIITVGYHLQSSLENAEIASRYENVFFTAGVHPSDCETLDNGVIARLFELLKHEKCLALGEIGLDYHYGKDNKEQQKIAFNKQLEMAGALGLPVVIHSREATQDMLNILTAHSKNLKKGFLMHCYSESAESAQEYFKLGAYFAFGGAITFKNAKKEDIIKSIPLDRVVCETDCPYMTPVPYRGQLNEPQRVKEVYVKMAEVYGLPLEQFVEIARQNAVNFFGESKLGERL